MSSVDAPSLSSSNAPLQDQRENRELICTVFEDLGKHFSTVFSPHATLQERSVALLNAFAACIEIVKNVYVLATYRLFYRTEEEIRTSVADLENNIELQWVLARSGKIEIDLQEQFMKSICVGDVEKARLWQEKGADVNAQDQYGLTPLKCAVIKGHLEIVKFLKENGADANVQGQDDVALLILAIINGHLPLVEFLLSCGIDVNVRDQDDWTPLMLATINGHFPLVEFLVTQSADVNAKNPEGFTPLMLAVFCQNFSLVEFLINNGADPQCTKP